MGAKLNIIAEFLPEHLVFATDHAFLHVDLPYEISPYRLKPFSLLLGLTVIFLDFTLQFIWRKL